MTQLDLDNAVLDEWRIPFGYWFDQMVDWMDINAGWYWTQSNGHSVFCSTISLIHTPAISWFWVVLSLWFSGLFPFTKNRASVRLCSCSLRLVGSGILAGHYTGLSEWSLCPLFFVQLLEFRLSCLCTSRWRMECSETCNGCYQVIHSFTYMVPFVFFFSIGVVPATMVTMIYALPPLVRLTNLGIRQVPEDVVEASRAYGALNQEF